jgi:hypothetical protein
MTDGLEPTEEYDGSLTVALYDDDGTRAEIRCTSYPEAIEVVKRKRDAYTVVDIVGADGEVVFTSADMDIEDWEVEWKQAKRRFSVDVEPRDCPYDNVACFADDLCVQCKIDKVQGQH